MSAIKIRDSRERRFGIDSEYHQKNEEADRTPNEGRAPHHTIHLTGPTAATRLRYSTGGAGSVAPPGTSKLYVQTLEYSTASERQPGDGMERRRRPPPGVGAMRGDDISGAAGVAGSSQGTL
jgi:hypothetical protein